MLEQQLKTNKFKCYSLLHTILPYFFICIVTNQTSIHHRHERSRRSRNPPTLIRAGFEQDEAALHAPESTTSRVHLA
jgi:hypothetical protein